jgi:hypothetical protein
MFIVGVSNQFGVEAWNSYAANYPRQLQVYAYPDFSLTITNVETGQWLNRPPLQSIYRQTPPPTIMPINAWKGYSASDLYNLSFQVPLSNNIIFLTNSTYRSPDASVNPDQFVPLTGTFELTTGTNLHVPHWSITARSRLRFAVVDTGRIVDYANLAAQTSLDLTDALMHDTANQYSACGPGTTIWTPSYTQGSMWCTNQPDGKTGDQFPTFGILNQIDVSLGHGGSGLWMGAMLDAPPGMSRDAAITYFRGQFIPGYASNAKTFDAPFQPYRNIYLFIIWQANDPLVHYTIGDLTDQTWTNRLELDFLSSPTPMSNLGNLNERYEPWGGFPGGRIGTVPPYDLTVKDPVARLYATSDDWGFPTNQTSGVNWLGHVHRGTPWQTVYLKAPGTSLTNWVHWTGNDLLVTNFGQLSTSLVPLNGVIYDASLTQPTNDWRLASMLASLLSTNDPRQFLSANQASVPAWEGALDGMVVLTNNEGPYPPNGLASLVMSSNSPQAATIATALDAMRSSQRDHYFPNPGDLLATPELSTASPWLDTSAVDQMYFSLTDEAYEAIPSQLLARLRADSVGAVVQNGGALQIQFSGIDGLAYAIQVSSNLHDWASLSTNQPFGGVFRFVEVPSPGAPPRYYRSVLLP